MLVDVMAIWSIFRPFDIFYGTLVQFVVLWCIFPVLVDLIVFGRLSLFKTKKITFTGVPKLT
jgi:hypothetical protein